MKKLIAISVVFALVAGVAFAVDLGGTVIGTVNVIQADSSGAKVTGSAGMNRVRVEGGGEVADGQFGGWLRIDPTGGTFIGIGYAEPHPWEAEDPDAEKFEKGFFAGLAWWKPIDQIKLSIGGNPDGIWGKEGNASWMFYQTASDTGVVKAGNAWGGGYGDLFMRKAFFGGFDGPRLYVEITPVDMVGINIAIPFFDGGDIGDIFMGTIAQIDLHMSFGNIALTYKGNSSIKASNVYGFFSLTAIDNLQLDFGLGADFQDSSGINLGVAVKYGADSWGIKFRSLFGIPTRSEQPFGMLFDVLPYFVINESFRAYISAGVNIGGIKDGDISGAGWHVNPYIEVGEEWGAKFLAGIQVSANGFTGGPTVSFAIPVALIVSF